jgi:hypothetical protein
MSNMEIYNKVRECPQNALRPITAGRLKGKSDINPMWRIQKLTELYGACGIGWYYTIDRQWTETGGNGEIAAFCDISLYVKDKDGGEWSKPIQGTGGSAFVSNEKAGLYTSDECFKMALTDAISVSCKALGFAADVYWGEGKTKYSAGDKHEEKTMPPVMIKATTHDAIEREAHRTGTALDKICTGYKVNTLKNLTEDQAQQALSALKNRPTKNAGV